MDMSASETELLSLTELVSLDLFYPFQGLLTHELNVPCGSAIHCFYVATPEGGREGVEVHHFWQHCLGLVEWQA